MKRINEAIDYIKFISAGDNNNGEEYLEKYSLFERAEILITVKIILAQLAVKNGADMTRKCYSCKYRGNVPGDTHSCCMNPIAYAIGDEHGIRHGWFFHPYNFDPVWLRYCDGYEEETNG